ncbi:MAG: acetate--CoA ligase family protein, partial [bacterium]|nr:acetate--CoA ligase family protein [bacterium]
KQGNISFVSQSGALISAMLDISAKENFGFSNIISIGNKMQISESDLFEYLEKDLETKVIGMYLEGIKNGDKFKNLAQKLSKIKPVVILKAGKTEKAKQAISSHTGALAGSEAVIQALFKKTGIVQVENFSEFLNILKLISITGVPLSEKVAVITNAGGPGVLTTDAFQGKEIKMAEFSEETKNKLRKSLPQESSVQNPIDLLGDAKEDRYEKILEIVKQTNEAGSVIILLTPQENTPVKKIAEKIVAFKNGANIPIIAVFLGGEKIKSSVELFNKSGIVNFYFPEQAIVSLDKYYLWKKYKETSENIDNPAEIDENRTEKIKEIIEKAKEEQRKALFFSEAKEIMDLYEIDTVKYQEVTPDTVLELDFPLVLKVDSDKILHKTDKQGLILNIKNEDELKEAYEKIAGNFPGEKIIIQPMEEIKTELILGIKKDETAGPVVVFGLGGIYTEIFKMVDFLIPPASLSEIREIILKSPIKFLFEESRGQKAHNLENFSGILKRLSVLAQEVQEIKELDINPLLIYNDGKKSLAVDIKIII